MCSDIHGEVRSTYVRGKFLRHDMPLNQPFLAKSVFFLPGYSIIIMISAITKKNLQIWRLHDEAARYLA
jgi:hypothetical protein